jgi:Protein of unknown function (DUF3565)
MLPIEVRSRSSSLGFGRVPDDGVFLLQRKVVGFHKDDESHWVAELDCGHAQHTRHDPPFFPRPWVLSEEGRMSWIAFAVIAKKSPKAM